MKQHTRDPNEIYFDDELLSASMWTSDSLANIITSKAVRPRSNTIAQQAHWLLSSLQTRRILDPVQLSRS